VKGPAAPLLTWTWYQLSDAVNRLGFNGTAARLKLKALKGDTAATGERARRDSSNAAHRKRLDELSEDTAYQYERLRNFKMVDLMERAALLNVEVPAPPAEGQENEYWTTGTFRRRPILTDRGIAYVRSNVYAQEREEREALLAWAPVVTGLVAAIAGLGGVLIGILSAVRR
jgi:hypothetical protein